MNKNSLSTNNTNSYKQNSQNSNSSFQKFNKNFHYHHLSNSNPSNNVKAKKKENSNSLKIFESKLKNYKIYSNKKLYELYNCSPSKYDSIILEYLLHNENCHLVSIFKDYMISDYIDEFLRRIYNIQESHERIPKFSDYYKNYFLFFCKPTFNNFSFNSIIQNYGENKAEIFYKKNYGNQGIENSDANENIEISSQSSEDENVFNDENIDNNNKNIFSEDIKKNINDVTDMTNITNVDNTTINLDLNNEQLEIFQGDKTNNSTLNDIINSFKKIHKKRIYQNKLFNNNNFFKRKKFFNYKFSNNNNNNNNKNNNNNNNINLLNKPFTGREKLNNKIFKKLTLDKVNKYLKKENFFSYSNLNKFTNSNNILKNNSNLKNNCNNIINNNKNKKNNSNKNNLPLSSDNSNRRSRNISNEFYKVNSCTIQINNKNSNININTINLNKNFPNNNLNIINKKYINNNDNNYYINNNIFKTMNFLLNKKNNNINNNNNNNNNNNKRKQKKFSDIENKIKNIKINLNKNELNKKRKYPSNLGNSNSLGSYNNNSNVLIFDHHSNYIKPVIKIQKNNYSKNNLNSNKISLKKTNHKDSHTKSSNDLMQYALSVYLENNTKKNNINLNNKFNNNAFHHLSNVNNNIFFNGINSINKRSRNSNSKDFTNNLINGGFYTKSVTYLTDIFNKDKFNKLFKSNKSKNRSKGK